jgi:VWFA-related protein
MNSRGERCFMKRIVALVLSAGMALCAVIAQTPQNPQKPPQKISPEDVIRITAELVQTDVVVMDKREQIVPDLKVEDFELYENGKKQDLQFAEFVSAGAPRAADLNASARVPPGVDTTVARDLTATDVRRVMAFVVDDVTIPSEDMSRVRDMLSDFVDHKMQDGDLVAIIRTVGGKGLLEQFTTDRQILRRAIAQLGVRSIPPYLSFGGADPGRLSGTPQPALDAMIGNTTGVASAGDTVTSSTEFSGPGEGTNQIPRALLALSVSNYIIDSLKQIPGRKSLVLLSGGLPLFQVTTGGSVTGDIGQLFRILTDNATRSGVVINTMDVRGLRATGVVAPFVETPGKSALGGGTFAGGDVSTVGRGYDVSLLGERSLSEQLTLRALAGNTGGVSVVNSNNFSEGLDRVLNRSKGYYRLAYRPSEKFDNKFHKVEVKVRRGGARVYGAEGYYAREDRAARPDSKVDQIIAAARSPLVKRDLDIAAELQYTFTANNQAQLDINTVVDAHRLNFKRTPEGKYHASFDVVGFVFDQFGKLRGGPDQTINADLTEAEYQRALATGIGYTASTLAPPGYYQVRLVVREADTGNIGSASRYFEVPDLNNKQLAMSSILLYEISPTGTSNNPVQLSATRVISRKQDLRYATVVYNAKQATARVIISQGNKLLFQEPDAPLKTSGSNPGQFLKVGQLGLSKVNPGHYVLTLVITDPAADKKHQTVWRSVDFTVVN